jgi:hypothetical protein
VDELQANDIKLLFKKLVLLEETQEKTPVKKEQPEDIQESQTTEKAIEPFAVIAPSDIIYQLKSPESNFRKIIVSLQLEHLTDALLAMEDLRESSQKEWDSLWVIGLSGEDHEVLEKRCRKILLSKNPEQEMSKEEKMELYNPLKAFADNLK